MTAGRLLLASEVIGDVARKEEGIPLSRGRRDSIGSVETMERSWKNQLELTVTTVMGTSFKVRMSSQETVLDIKRRIYFREGDMLAHAFLIRV